MTGSNLFARPVRVFVPAGFAAASAALGWIGLWITTGDSVEYADATLLDITYFTAQLFVLGSEPLDANGPFPLALEIARITAPISAALAVISVVVRGRLTQWRLAQQQGHAIVTGDNDVSWALAEMLAEDQPVTVISADFDGARGRLPGIDVVTGIAEEGAVLKAAGVAGASSLYACGDDGSANVGIALLARSLAEGPIVARVRSADAELVAALRARRLGREDRDGGFRLDFFAVEAQAARVLLDEHPPFEADGSLPIVVQGAGDFGRAVLLELLDRRPRYWAGPVVWIVSETDEADRFLSAHGVADQVEVATARDGRPSCCLYVCESDPDKALRVGLGAVRTLPGAVVICLPARSAIGEALEVADVFDNIDGRLAVFGILDAGCEPLRVANDLVDQLARGLHQQYVEVSRARGDTIASNPSTVPWVMLPEKLKQSNYDQAEHIGVKMDAINATIIPALDRMTAFSFSNEEIERLAEMEHERWMAWMEKDGVVLGEDRIAGETHPDMLPWDRLSDAVKEKDRAFVRRIPELLATKRLAVVRLAWQKSVGP